MKRNATSTLSGAILTYMVIALFSGPELHAHVKCRVNLGFGNYTDGCPVHNHPPTFHQAPSYYDQSGSRTPSWKEGNNNSVTCDTFCRGKQWGGWIGSCIKGYDNIHQKVISCNGLGAVSGLSNVKCLCVP